VRFVSTQSLRRLASAASVALALLAIDGSGTAFAQMPPRVVKDPHYGDTLFYFFQTRYFTSVTNLMVSQHFERLPNHPDDAEILRGGLFLSYGLHKEAGEIFAQIIEHGASPAVRDRAWFYLAKIRYQRGLLAQAEEAINRITHWLTPELEEERILLKANLLMAREDYAGAAKELELVRSKTGPALYARFNLGVALVKSGDDSRGTAMLDEVGKTPAMTEEYRALRDKANLALGFSALQRNSPERARAYLARVRLNGMLANKALLGFGWASAALKQPQAALVPWTELSARTPADAAVLEAKLAVPYAFAELGAFGQALDRYKDAIAIFEHENTDLDESIAAIRAGKLLAGLLERNPGEEMGWFWNITELPEMPHGAHLAQVLAQHEFQEAFKNYRDLQFLSNNLAHWQESLGALNDMLVNRRRAFADRLPVIQAQERALNIMDLERRRDEVTNDLAAAEQQGDGVALADARERDLLERFERVRKLLERAGSEPDPEVEALRRRDVYLAIVRETTRSKLVERFRRVAGALTWQLSDAFAARLWDAKKSLREIDNGLVEAIERDAALTRAQSEEPGRFDQLGGRIAELDQRLRAMTPRVATLMAEQQQYVQDLAVAALGQQKERLASYGTQARFAVAQIYDRARLARENSNANGQQ
jgi:tetratricopeptide (TPR) repeat protein